MHAIKVVAISSSACTFLFPATEKKKLKLYNLQKDGISTQKQPGCKNGAALFKNGQFEKSCEIKEGAKKWL